MSHVESPEIEVFEDKLVDGALDGREREEGFREKERGLRGRNAENGGEEVRPDFAL